MRKPQAAAGVPDDAPSEVNGVPVEPIHPYGFGIDCHSRFIVACLLLPAGDLLRWEHEFGVAEADLFAARDWARGVLTSRGLDSDPLRYTLESTGCYHLPVILALGGRPSIVNPLIAGSSRRKTDRLDARLLAYHSLVQRGDGGDARHVLSDRSGHDSGPADAEVAHDRARRGRGDRAELALGSLRRVAVSESQGRRGVRWI